MKKLFYAGVIGLALFEIGNVFFIMPMPGSQRMNSIEIAYFLYSYRWAFRVGFLILVLSGANHAFKTKRIWIPSLALLAMATILYMFNFKMKADHMFLEPEMVKFQNRANHMLNDSSVVVAVKSHGYAKAYPVRYILYHHQVRDSIAGRPIMVTYCNVCRTGRVFDPVIGGNNERFRLVGMDHFNAMFEDETTKSWWRQATGEAITGSMKGVHLSEVESSQMTLGKFFSLYPFGEVMEADKTSKDHYDSLGKFEYGRSKGKLTRRDSLSWKDKSWVIGVQAGPHSRAYDWNLLLAERMIHDKIGDTYVILALDDDNQSFIAFSRSPEENFLLKNDSLISNRDHYSFAGVGRSGSELKKLPAFQEFWHSWKTFHPDTDMYSKPANEINTK
jgi:hypothetical protein